MTATITKKIFNVLGNEWSSDTGKKSIIYCTLYVLKSDEAVLLKLFSDCMRHVGYNICPADLYIWIKLKVDSDNDRYYSYILFHVDDILVVYHNAMTMLNNNNKYFKLKPDSICDTEIYLGDNLCYHSSNNGVYA